MAKGAPGKITPQDYMPLVSSQAKYNRKDVTATGMGSRSFGPEGNVSFNLDPSLTDTDALTQAMYDKRMRLMRPEYDRQEASMMQSLANRGLPSGGEAYNDELSLFRRNRDEAYGSAADSAVMGGEGARSQRLAQALGFLGYNPPPVDISGPAQIAQSANNAQAQANANAKGGATGLAGTALMANALA